MSTFRQCCASWSSNPHEKHCHTQLNEPTLDQWRDPDGRVWTPNYINGSWYVYAGVEAMSGPFANRHDATAHIAEVANMMERNA